MLDALRAELAEKKEALARAVQQQKAAEEALCNRTAFLAELSCARADIEHVVDTVTLFPELTGIKYFPYIDWVLTC